MKRLAALALMWVGCTQPIAPQFAETAEVLKRGKLGLTVSGGGYGDGIPYQSGFTGAAGAVRLREGVGAHQELGVEGYVALFDSPQNYVWGAKLEWKGAPTRWLALLAGASAISENGSPAFGYDLGFVVSPAPSRWRAQPYLAMRGTFTELLTEQPDPGANVTGPSVALLVAGGLQVRLSSTLSLFLEGAPFWHWDWLKEQMQTNRGLVLGRWEVSGGGPRPNGGYGALALAFHLN